MARPQKSETDKRTERLPHVRCTKGEKATIASKAAQAGMSVSDYIRKMAIEGEVVVRESQTDFALVDQLRRIGVNINQITQRLHQTEKLPPDLSNVWRRLNNLLDRVIL